MKTFVLAPFLAALAMFAWGFVYWGTPHLLPYKSLGRVADDAATAEAIGKMFPTSGAYLLPSPLLGEEKMQGLSQRGPSLEVHVLKESFGMPEMGKVMAIGFVHNFVIALLLAIMLTGLAKAFRFWTCRVKFCAFLGFLVMIGEMSPAIWWHHSVAWTFANAFYVFALLTIAGLVLAKFVTPKTEAPAA